jgi:hypothetical protein
VTNFSLGTAAGRRLAVRKAWREECVLAWCVWGLLVADRCFVLEAVSRTDRPVPVI